MIIYLKFRADRTWHLDTCDEFKGFRGRTYDTSDTNPPNERILDNVEQILTASSQFVDLIIIGDELRTPKESLSKRLLVSEYLPDDRAVMLSYGYNIPLELQAYIELYNAESRRIRCIEQAIATNYGRWLDPRDLTDYTASLAFATYYTTEKTLDGNRIPDDVLRVWQKLSNHTPLAQPTAVVHNFSFQYA